MGPRLAVDAAGVETCFNQALLEQPGLVDLAFEKPLGVDIEHDRLIAAIAETHRHPSPVGGDPEILAEFIA